MRLTTTTVAIRTAATPRIAARISPAGPGPYSNEVTAAHDYSDLHELIDRLEPEQAEELRAFALGLVRPESRRFRVLRTFEGPDTDLGARARDVMRTEFGHSDADR